MIKISMFSGPRNISTTMMRSFESRADTAVFDEPFYGCYLNATGAQHPMRDETLAAQPTQWQDVIDQLNAPLPNGATIAFQKHITFHFIDSAPLEWIKDTRPLILIRDPRAMVASYKNKYDDVAPIIESFKIQRKIFDDCDRRNAPCPIIDARDVLTAPAPMLKKLCSALEIDFDPAMLRWREGPRNSDGVWAPHWYDAVWASTGFKPYVEKPITLPPGLADIAAACANDYAYLYDRRLHI